MLNVDIIRKKYDYIVVWGCGKIFEQKYHKEYKIDYLVDSSEKKIGTYFDGLQVISPWELKDKKLQNVAVIIYTQFWESVIESMQQLEIEMDVYLACMLDMQFLDNYVKHAYKRSFALFGEDAVVKGIADRYNIAIKHYMDIGANHPFYGNATALFYMEGASGVLVEPNPKYAEVLKLHRPFDTIYNVGIAGKENNGLEQPYYMVEGLDTRNTFSKTVAQKYIDDGFKVTTMQMQLMSLDALIELYGKKVNYISIDVEGLEWEILKDFNFEKYDIEIFNIEKGNQNVKELLLKKGYRLVAETLSDWIFVKADLISEERVLQTIKSNFMKNGEMNK